MTGPLPRSSHGKPIDVFPPAADLERALKREVRGEVRFDPRQPRAVRDRRLQLPPDSDRARRPARRRRCDRRRGGRAARIGAPVLPRGAGTSLAGQCCNVAVVLDFTKYMNRILEIDPVQRFARVQPGVVLDTLRNARGSAQAHLRPGSLHAQPLHARRHDRQQLVRHALAAGGQDGRQRRGAATILLYDGTELTVGRDRATPSSTRSSRRAAAAARSTPALRAIRDRYADRDPRALPDDSAARVRLQPRRTAARERLPRRARAGRQRRHVRDRARGEGSS